MSTIVLKAVLAAGTGTGATYADWDLSGANALFREQSPAGVAAELKFRRRDPKPTRDFVGQMGGEIKLTRQFADSLGRLRPGIVTVSSGLPAFLTDAQKTAFVTEALLAAQTAESQACLAVGKVPQS